MSIEDDFPVDGESSDEVTLLRMGRFIKSIHANIRYGSNKGWFIHIENERRSIDLPLSRTNDHSFFIDLRDIQ